MESRQKINDAIKELHYIHEKITQRRVAEVTKMHLQTVKKYWTEFKPKVKQINQSLISDLIVFENN